MRKHSPTRRRRWASLEPLESRHLLAGVPTALGPGTICGPLGTHDLLGTEAAYFSGNQWDCGGRLDYEGLWRTDGSAEGTRSLGDNLAETILADEVFAAGGELLFNAITGGRLESVAFRSNGQAGSAKPLGVADNRVGAQLGDRILYTCIHTCNDHQGGRITAFDGQTHVNLIETSEAGPNPYMFPIRQLGDDAFIGGEALWRTDGTPGGTEVFQSFPDSIVRVVGSTGDGNFYFWVEQAGRAKLWLTDGTAAGTRPIESSLRVGQHSKQTRVWNDKLLVYDSQARRLFLVEGTEAEYLSAGAPGIDFLYEWNDRAVLANQGELFITDGTAEGSLQIHSDPGSHFSANHMFPTNDWLYFEPWYRRPSEAKQIYRTDGLSSTPIGGPGARMLASSPLAAFYLEGDTIWVLADDSTEPIRFADFVGVAATDVHATFANGLVLFSAPDSGVPKFWITDGTPEGTEVLANYPTEVLEPDPDFGDQFEGFENFSPFQDQLIFQGTFDPNLGVRNQLYSLTAPARDAPQTADFNGDGEISFGDFLVLASHFGKSDATHEQGDIDGSGAVDFTDFLLFAVEFLKHNGGDA